jgi:NAD(P)-dependent dehydrogenase (short-subunit alcohol dehydrogenase family)
MSNNIQEKVVVITGASSGLAEWISKGGNALAVTTDVPHCDQVKR